MVKILQVEDLKNVDIVERIRKDLGQQMFVTKRNSPKIVSERPLMKESKYPEIQQTVIEETASLAASSTDRQVVQILKVEDLKSMDMVERMRKDFGQQMILSKRDSPKIISEVQLKKENKDTDIQKTAIEAGRTDEPMVKILKVEDLRNLEIVERIRKDVGQQMSLAKRDFPKMASEVSREKESKYPVIQRTTIEDKQSLVASTTDGSIVKILKVEDLKNVDIVERIRKDIEHLKKESRDLETQKTEDKQYLVDNSTDEQMVNILKVEDLKNVDVVERIGKNLGLQMFVTKRYSPRPTSKILAEKITLNEEIEETATEGKRSLIDSSPDEPMVKILKVEDLKNTDIVENIQKHGGEQSLLAKRDSPKITSDLPSENESEDPEIQETTTDAKPSNSPHKKILSKFSTNTKNPVSNERRRIFLKLTASDVKPVPKKTPTCELPWENVKKPVDTIRCHKCAVLYQTDILKSHVKICKGQLPKSRYSCAQCSFSNTSYSELADHVKEEHSKKT
nr:unnamed protein product [Callosobruchus chinensis]